MIETGLLELGFEFGNKCHRFGVQVVQVENEQRWFLILRRVVDSRHCILVAFYKFDLDAQLARRLLNLDEEEKILDETEDACGSVFADRRGWRLRIDIGIISAAVAALLTSSEWSKAVRQPRCHWPHDSYGPWGRRMSAGLFACHPYACPAAGPRDAIAGRNRRGRRPLEELLFLPALVVMGRLWRRGMLRSGRFGGHLRLCLLGLAFASRPVGWICSYGAGVCADALTTAP